MKFFAILPGLLIPALASGQLVRETNTTLNLPATLPSATGYTTANALGNITFNAPMATAIVAGDSSRLFVAQRAGSIRLVKNMNSTPQLVAGNYISLSSLLPTGQSVRSDFENGFLSMVFHPDFTNNGRLFVYFSMQDSGGQLFQRLHEITVEDPSADVAVIESHQPLLTLLDRAGNHNGGDLHFDSFGYLYLSLGDEGGGDDSFNNSRFIHQSGNRIGFWGQLLRMDVDDKPGSIAPNPHTQNSGTFPSAVHSGSYKIPADNPFIGATEWHGESIPSASVRTEIFATGLRNPFRWSFDPPTGRLFLADVGQGAREEINLVAKGDDLGWSWREGLLPFNKPPAPPSAPDFDPVDPFFDYDRSNNGSVNDHIIYGTSVTGGRVYRGNLLTELYGDYVFADYNSGIIAALRENPDGTWTGRRLVTNESGISHFGVDPRNGDLLMCNLGAGQVKRLVRSGTSGTAPPTTLSATGVFSNLSELTTHPGIVSYNLNVPFWSDHAEKKRWFLMDDEEETIGYQRDGNWTFPTGMVWIKHFDLETTPGNPATSRKWETRIIRKTADGTYGLSYRWREDQSDADLVVEEGVTVEVPDGVPSRSWRFPSRSECTACHTPAGGHALGFNTRQLNRMHDFGSESLNQLQAFGEAGFLDMEVPDFKSLPALSHPENDAVSLEDRVRSYLTANCVQCHQPGGPATGNWDARATTATDDAGIINGLLANTLGDPLKRFVVPGNPGNSMVLQRLAASNHLRMPPLGSFVTDADAVALLTDWIEQDLPGRMSFRQWQEFHFDSADDPNAAADFDDDGDGQSNHFEYLTGTNPRSSADAWSWGETTSTEGSFVFRFVQAANRAAIVETSTTLLGNDWQIWDVEGNAPFYPAEAQDRVITGPTDDERRFFRVKFMER